MGTTPKDPAFWDLYDRLTAEHGLVNNTAAEAASKVGTIAAVAANYLASARFANLSPRTKSLYRQVIGVIKDVFGGREAVSITREEIIEQMDLRAETPGAANNFLKILSVLFAHAMNTKGYRVQYNPCAHIEKLRVGEIEPWQWAAVKFAEKHMRPYMWRAVALAVYTGQRQSDCLRMAWPDVGSDMISVVVSPDKGAGDASTQLTASAALRLICEDTGVTPDLAEYRQQKTRTRLWIPIHRELRVLLDSIIERGDTILVNQSMQPWTTDGFKSQWSNELARKELAPLKALGVKFHGLRKTATIKLLEAGCTDEEAQAITGHSRQMLEHYSKRSNQKELARSAIKKWERRA